MKHKIRNLGSFLTTETSGKFQSIGNANMVKGVWRSALDDITNEIKYHVGQNNLISLYVRGSVAKGEAIEGISDLDCFILTTDMSLMEDKERKISLKKSILQKYPSITDVELSYTVPEKITTGQNYWRRFTLKTQSAHIYGKDIAQSFEDFYPTAELANMVKDNLSMRYEQTKEYLDKYEDNNYELKKTCVWLMKRILRMGGLILMERSKKFSRDLYPNYELFSEYHPNKKKEMYEVLELAINPTDNPQIIIAIIEGIGKWLDDEANRVLN